MYRLPGSYPFSYRYVRISLSVLAKMSFDRFLADNTISLGHSCMCGSCFPDGPCFHGMGNFGKFDRICDLSACLAFTDLGPCGCTGWLFGNVGFRMCSWVAACTDTGDVSVEPGIARSAMAESPTLNINF